MNNPRWIHWPSSRALVFLSARFHFCGRFLKTLSRYRWSEICILCNSNLVLSLWQSSPRTSFLVLAVLADSPLRTSFLVPEDRVSSYRRSWEHAVGSWLLFRTSDVRWNITLIQHVILRAIRSTRILWRVFLCAQEFPWHQTHWSRFRHCRAFFRRASWALLDMTLCFLFERKWLQENIEKFTMLKIEIRWCHTSRVKLLWVNIPASWVLVSTYLIWIWGSKLILSNSQSNATLWVPDTCLIVGLLTLRIILITASLSSKMYNWDSPWENFAFVVT